MLKFINKGENYFNICLGNKSLNFDILEINDKLDGV